jgi:Secretion system C-terminal sorting domain
MKMIFILTTLLLTNIIGLFGQITVTNSAFPVAGDSIFYAIDTFVNVQIGTSGSNQIWDYSALGANIERTKVYEAAANGQNFATFPNAELVVIGQANETYYNKTATRFENTGFQGAAAGFPIPLTLKFLPPVADRRAPLTFGSFPNLEKTDLTVTLPSVAIPNIPATIDSIRVKIHFERIDFVDGWGSLKLPAFTQNVLREKRFQTTDTKIELHTTVPFPIWISSPFPIPGAGLDTTITYNFFSLNDKDAIATVNMNNDETKASSIQYKRSKTTAIGDFLETNDRRASVQAYPNPAMEYTVFYCSNVPEGNYKLKLYNVIGDVVWQQNHSINGSKNIRLDVGNFKKGTYLYSLSDEKGKILATKRLMIIKP